MCKAKGGCSRWWRSLERRQRCLTCIRFLAMEIFSKKQMQEVEEHVKLLTSKETELAEAIERLEAEGEVVLQIH